MQTDAGEPQNKRSGSPQRKSSVFFDLTKKPRLEQNQENDVINIDTDEDSTSSRDGSDNVENVRLFM